MLCIGSVSVAIFRPVPLGVLSESFNPFTGPGMRRTLVVSLCCRWVSNCVLGVRIKFDCLLVKLVYNLEVCKPNNNLSMKKLIVIISLISTYAFAQNLFVTANGGYIYRYTSDGVKSTFAQGPFTPVSIACDNSGNVFVAANNSYIYKYTPDGTQSVFAQGPFNAIAITCDNAGNLFEAANNSYIYKYAPDGTRSVFAQTALFTATSIAFQSPPVPPVLQIVWPNDAQLVVNVSGIYGQIVTLQSSSDLQNWTPIATAIFTSDSWSYTNNTPQSVIAQFYRATVSWP